MQLVACMWLLTHPPCICCMRLSNATSIFTQHQKHLAEVFVAWQCSSGAVCPQDEVSDHQVLQQTAALAEHLQGKWGALW